MRSLLVFVLPLLLLTGCGSKNPFEGKWTAEIPGPDGKTATATNDIKADGTFEMTFTAPGGKADNNTGKWKKTGDKTIELTTDKGSQGTAKGVLIDDKTMELTPPKGDDKLKFTKK